MKAKEIDKRAFIFYIVTSLVLWQFGASIRDLCIKPYFQRITEDNPILSFVYFKNTGAAFNILNDKADLLAFFGVLALCAIVFWAYKNLEFKDKFKMLTAVSLTSGVIGNLVERLTNGYVVDFIKLNFINFAVFNFFDILITVSITLFAGLIIYDEIKKYIAKYKG